MLELFCGLRPKADVSLAASKYPVTELLNAVLVPSHFAVFTRYLKCGDPVSSSYTERTLPKGAVQVLFMIVCKGESITEVRYTVGIPAVE